MGRIILFILLISSFVSFGQTFNMKSSRDGDTVQKIIQTTKSGGIVKYLLITGTDTAEIRWDGTALLIEGYNIQDSTDLQTDTLQAHRVDINSKLNTDGTNAMTGALTLSKGSQNYLFTDQSIAIAIQSQTSGSDSEVNLFSKDGDGTDDIELKLFGVGTQTSIGTRELLTIRYSTGGSEYQIYTTHNNSTLRPITLFTWGNTDQLKLNIDGTILMSGDLTASQYNVSALNSAPSSAGDTGTLGEIRITADYIYVCTSTDTWKRTEITTW